MEPKDTGLQLGVSIPTWDNSAGQQAGWAEMHEIARLAEEIGFDSLWVPDHLLRDLPDGRIFGFWECWTILSAIAALTSRATVGSFVACTGFHNPAHLAKMAATLDEVSGGRAILTLGAGVPDHDRSWQAFGFQADHPAGRFEEAIEIIVRLLRGERLTFEGQYFNAVDCELAPRGPRPGSLPVWAAGKGPRTMRVAAKWADAFNLNVTCYSAGDVTTHLAKLDEACRAVERDPATLARTGYTVISFAGAGSMHSKVREAAIKGTPEQIATSLHKMYLAGLEHITCYIDDGEGPGGSAFPATTRRGLELFAPVIEALRTM